MKKTRIIGISLFIPLVLATIVGILLGTQMGLRFLGGQIEKLTAKQLEIGELHGRLLGSWSVKKIRYSSPSISLNLENFSCVVKPASLLKGEVHFQLLEGETFQLRLAETEESKDQKESQKSSFVLPLGIIVEEFNLNNGEVSQGGETYAFNTLQLRGKADSNGLQVSSLRLDSPVMTAELLGAVSLSDNFPWQATLRVDNLAPTYLNEEWPGVYKGEIRGSGSFKDTIEAEFELVNLLAEVNEQSLELKGKGRFKNNILSLSDGVLTHETSQLLFYGTVGEELNMQYRILAPKLQKIAADLEGGMEVAGKITGKIGQPEVSANMRGDSLVIQGKRIDSLAATLVTRVLENKDIDAHLSVNEIITGDTKIVGNTLHFLGSVDSHRLSLDLSPELGQLSLQLAGGYIEDSWQGGIEVVQVQYPEKKQWTMKQRTPLSVSAHSAKLESFCLEHKKEKICVLGSWLNEGMVWSGKLSFDNIDPTSLAPEWAGEVSGQLLGKGAETGGSFHHEIEIASLSGRAADEPVQGAGKVIIDERGVVVDDFSLDFADTHFLAKGIISDLFDLSFKVHSPDLAKAMPDLAGKLELFGSVKGSREEPTAFFEFNVDGGHVTGVDIEKLFGKVSLDFGPDGRVFTKIEGQNIQGEGFVVYRSNIEVEGTAKNHRLEVRATSSKGNAQLLGTGQLEKELWKGKFQKLDLSGTEFGNWQLDGQPELTLGKSEANISSFCMLGLGGATCLDGQWKKDAPWYGALTINQLTLGPLFKHFVPSTPFQGDVQASFEAKGVGVVPQWAKGSISLPEANLELTTENEKKYLLKLRDNLLSYTLEDQILAAKVKASTEAGSVIDSDLEIRGITEEGLKAMSDLPVIGRLDVMVKDLSFLSHVTEFFLKATGGLSGGFQFAGPLSKPKIEGDLILDKGELVIPSFGVTLDNLTASLEADGDNMKLLYGSEKKEGHLKGEARLRLGEDGWGVDGQLHGENFELVNLPEYNVFVEPELQYSVNSEGALVKGRLAIPRARIAPTGGSGGVSSSGDVVFVDEDEKPEKQMKVTSDIVLMLGDDVELDSHGLKSQLKGKLTVKSIPGRGVTGNGDIVLKDGTFTFYGQTFDIERGRLFYAGGAIDNPGIDVRAQKTIGETVVGVDIGGTASDYDLNLFSSPNMEERDILAYLIIGRSGTLGDEDDGDLLGAAAAAVGLAGVNKVTKGVGNRLGVDEIHLEGGTGNEDMSLVVGKNITEDLFIGYDHDFFNSTGEFRVRYKLGKGFSIETRSSAASTSGDLLYSIER